MADILMIEDDTAIRELVKAHLGRAEHDVREAANGRDGIDMAHHKRPDVIILDLNMPVMDGPATLKAIRAEPSLCSVPVIAISAMAVPELRDDLHAMGCDAYVTKPIRFEILLEHIDNIVRT